MTQEEQLKEIARSKARNALALSPSFRSMPIKDQKSIYRETVKAEYDKLAHQSGLTTAMANVPKASDNIDDSRHAPNYEAGVDAFKDLQEDINFADFVGDLLRSVFDANMDVMKSQTDDYIRLMKQATTDLASFINKIDDTTTFAYLAENNSDEFGMSFQDLDDDSDSGNSGDGQKTVLTNSNGEPVDLGDNQIKAKIMEAKIAMAKEHRTALREMILMGVTRLVVEKGKVKAGVVFDFKANRNVQKQDKALNKNSTSSGKSSRVGGGLFGIFRAGGGSTSSTRNTNMSVSSAKSVANDELKAKLMGEVEIVFKTDHFQLDNFAQMYGPVTNNGSQQAAPPTSPTPK
ncbi:MULTISPECIES: hypothetical protein [Roseivirga]|jgi:hypothetical protein|uniref:Uncharacterized protein n=1 Tax=Roseivirga thermotolerans TaxID=1758176 RepID=A0ABQ3I3G8_9BACT|nr:MULTISPECIES: hypothetical protein [Roseivirga]MEC7754068.1 hypothetical protein [Bacteroidota bacterium]GHE60961.1 hypothetical protein GCM10011340_14830 [Roseivirga thermotolerans]|tara:strand:+ start:4603 stop:5643 length:1041 start_codon:yes stop_codon:yes gene_type:complete